MGANSYFLIHFESPIKPLRPLMEELTLDPDIVRPRILRAEEMVSRPCEHRACDFGELTEESHLRIREESKTYIKKL